MVRLTQFSHGGGCGCKISPAILSQILKELPLTVPDPALLVGAETSDDAAVYKVTDDIALVLTTDFFMPIVDDAFDFGRIAATNALSDVYAMGGKPIVALAVLGMPIDKLPVGEIREIMRGATEACKNSRISIAGGHSIDSPEPIFGLVVAGLVSTKRVLKNSNAKAGDKLILLKPLGVGVLTTALKRDLLDANAYQEVVSVMTQANAIGAALHEIDGVHALTDVTGFGLLGHLLEVCRGSHLRAEISFGAVPILAEAKRLALQNCFPGGAERNLRSFESEVSFASSLSAQDILLLCDPQTSGGLLCAAHPDAVFNVVSLAKENGFEYAAEIGTLSSDKPGVDVRV